MKKSSSSSKVPEQKGAISLSEQYSGKFRREGETLMRDIQNHAMRQDGMRMTLHTPKT